MGGVVRRQENANRGIGGAMSNLLGGLSSRVLLRGTGLSTLNRKRSELIVAVDFTKSNTWKGEESFGGKPLHSVDGPLNPYMQVLDLTARELGVYDADNRIPCYGFGDCRTGGDSVFSFFANNIPANGLESLLGRYRQIASHVDMSGPTNFAPLIRQAMRDVYNSDMKFHILLIIADGEVSEECMEDTRRAIIDACAFPLSIVVIGVGDGPWDAMHGFDNNLPERDWDNFHFTPFNAVSANGQVGNDFRTSVLAEVAQQSSHVSRLTGVASKQQVAHIVHGILSNVLDPPPGRN